MKKNIYLLIILAITNVSMADFSDPSLQTCYPYITDEWPNYRYKITSTNGETTVTDKRTGLMWKQCLEGLSGPNCETGETLSVYNWSQALMLPETINSTTGFAGKFDWRVPNVEELRSLAALNCYYPAINLDVFPRTPNATLIFSSTPVLNIFGDEDAWYMNTDSGATSWTNREGLVGLLPLRLVRDSN